MIEMTFYNYAFSIQFCVVHLRCNNFLHALVYYSGILFTHVFGHTVISLILRVFPSRGNMYFIELSFLA